MHKHFFFLLDCLQLFVVAGVVYFGNGKSEWFVFPAAFNFSLLGLFFLCGLVVYGVGKWIAVLGYRERFFQFVLLVMMLKTLLVIGLGIFLFWSEFLSGIASLVPFFLYYLSFTYLLIRAVHWAEIHSRLSSNR
jgi:hypothetical protein